MSPVSREAIKTAIMRDHLDKTIEVDRLRQINADLLAALEALVDAPLRYNGNRVEIDCADHADAMQRVRTARAAIAKAKGAA